MNNGDLNAPVPTMRVESAQPVFKLYATDSDQRRHDEHQALALNKADLSTILALHASSPWVFAAVNRITMAVAAVRRRFFRHGPDGKLRRADDTHLEKLLSCPNPFQCWEDLMEQTVGDITVVGWSFWEKAFDESGEKVVGLMRMLPDRVRIVPDAERYWKGIEFERRPGEKVMLDPQEIVMFRRWSLSSDYSPVSGLIASQGTIVWELYGRAWNTSLFKNGAAGLPEGIFKTKSKLDDASYKRIREAIKNRIGHPDVWRDILILDQGLEFVPTAATARDLQFDELMSRARDSMLASMGVPPALVGVPISGGLGGWKEQRMQFYQITVLPLLKKIESTINRYLAADGEEMRFDLQDILSLVEDMDSIASQAERLVTRGIRTINETRDEAGLGPLPWGDVWHAPLGLAPVGAPARPERPEGLGGAAAEQKVAPEGMEDAELRGEMLKAAQRNVRQQFRREIAGAYRRAFDEVKRLVFGRVRASLVPDIAKAGPAAGATLPAGFEPIGGGEFQQLVGDALLSDLKRLSNRAGQASAHALGVAFKDVTETPQFRRVLDSWLKDRLSSTANTVANGVKQEAERLAARNLSPDKFVRELESSFDRMIDSRIDDLSASDATTFTTSATEAVGADTFTHKVWITSGGPNVRASEQGENHQVMQGEIVRIDEKFMVPSRAGSVAMDGPGDPAGSADTVSYCECSIQLLTAAEAAAMGAR